MPVAYYNEHDPFAAAWLRALIAADLIALGDVDERSIEDVRPDDLRAYGQHHFFAGIGVWSAALRDAGWPDDRPVWTGSCPCQPFSAAGKGAGFDDERHLWPSWFWLIRELRPDVVFGEQVAAPAGLQWFDLVSSDLEGEGYAVGAHDLCAAGVGAPHIRQRLFFVAHHHLGRHARRQISASNDDRRHGARFDQRHQSEPRDLSLSESKFAGRGVVDASSEQAGLPRRTRQPGGAGAMGVAAASGRPRVGEAAAYVVPGLAGETLGPLQHAASDGRIEWGSEPERRRAAGSWGAPDWIPCRDGKWRPVEPGTFPLAHGAPARVGRLRGYGNAIVKPVAQAFIEAAMSVMP